MGWGQQKFFSLVATQRRCRGRTDKQFPGKSWATISGIEAHKENPTFTSQHIQAWVIVQRFDLARGEGPLQLVHPSEPVRAGTAEQRAAGHY